MTEPTPFRRLRDQPPEIQAKIQAKSGELTTATRKILDVFGARMPADSIEGLRLNQRAGEWGLMFDTFCATVVKARVPVTVAERDLIAETIARFGPNPGRDMEFVADASGVLAGLTVIDDDGHQISPPPDFDAENWWPRGYPARFRWGRLGGHRHDTGIPHKTTFPPSWDAEKINAQVLDVARNPDDVPEQDRNGGWITRGVRDNIRIEVRLRPDGPIITGYPVSGLGVHRTDSDGHPTEQQW